MVKALFALAKYLTWWFFKPLVSRCCVANLTHMLQTSSFNQTHVLVASNRYFPFLLGGENIHNYFIKSIASSHYFIKSIASSRCVEDTPGNTLVNTVVHDKYSWTHSSGVSKAQFRVIPRIALSRLVYCSSIHCPLLTMIVLINFVLIWMCLVLQRDSRTVTQQTLRYKPNGLARMACKSSSVINLVNQTRFECSLLY